MNPLFSASSGRGIILRPPCGVGGSLSHLMRSLRDIFELEKCGTGFASEVPFLHFCAISEPDYEFVLPGGEVGGRRSAQLFLTLPHYDLPAVFSGVRPPTASEFAEWKRFSLNSL
jgi:hypothetical protein